MASDVIYGQRHRASGPTRRHPQGRAIINRHEEEDKTLPSVPAMLKGSISWGPPARGRKRTRLTSVRRRYMERGGEGDDALGKRRSFWGENVRQDAKLRVQTARGQRGGQDENLISAFPNLLTQNRPDCTCGAFFCHSKFKKKYSYWLLPESTNSKDYQKLHISYGDI